MTRLIENISDFFFFVKKRPVPANDGYFFVPDDIALRTHTSIYPNCIAILEQQPEHF